MNPDRQQQTPTSQPVQASQQSLVSDQSNQITQPTQPLAQTGVSQNNRQKRKGLSDILSIGAVLVSAFALAFLLVAFVFQSYQVDGQSMQNTLQDYDHLIVWKVPRTWARITHHAYVPKRGDIIVFNEPGLPEFGNSNKQLIKRVMGLPGDHITIKNNVVTIYNAAHPKGFQPDRTLPYGKAIGDTSGNVDLTLGKNQLFVCGDNRDNSLDSRVFGPIDTNNVVGKLILRVLPLDQAAKF